MFPRLLLTALALPFATSALFAEAVRPVPPPGVAVPDADRAELEKGVAALEKEIQDLFQAPTGGLLRETANLEIFYKAVDWALRYNEFFNPKQIETAKKLLAEGSARVAAMKKRDASGMLNPPWNSATGLVVRGYSSAIDGSIQPYGLVIPEDWKPGEKTPRPLHFWCHGRGEQLSELSFVEDRMNNKGEFTPPGAIVCHLYGRFCCANKFAGEQDLLEVLVDIKKHYNIDDQRLVIRGFSMGGASTWQFGTHFPGMWAAVAPGAGFAETAEFFHVFGPGKTPPPWWEQVLWRWYDCTTMAGNLADTKTVAYSGEIDGQKQAADIMVKYAKEEGIEFPHIIGPQTPHKYHPDSKPKIEEFVTEAVKAGHDPFAKKVRFTTYTLIYPRVDWVTVTGMDKEWERADITVERGEGGKVQVATKNIIEFVLTPPKPEDIAETLTIDGAEVKRGAPVKESSFMREKRDATWTGAELVDMDSPCFAFVKKDGKWSAVEQAALDGRSPAERKSPDICGPIDHAFMSRFLFVRPTGSPINTAVGAWAKSEMEHAQAFWRKVYRGDAPIKNDTEVTAEDIKDCNLVLWGDPSSNAVWHRMLTLGVREGGHSKDPRGLPISWTKDALTVNGVKYDAAHSVPVMIFPNPLNQQRYVVINSGPTFREEALLNNSDQTPKLPDWAIIDLNTPPDAKWPGLVVDAGFFDEHWKP